jgi:hypothetical protein
MVYDIAIPIETQADRHELVAGENFTVQVTISGMPIVPVKWNLDASSFLVPAGWTITPTETKPSGDEARFQIAIPAGAKPPSSPGDAILPFPPALVELALQASVDGYAFTIERPINSVEASTTGILTYPLELVSARHAHRRSSAVDDAAEESGRAAQAARAREVSRNEAGKI